MQLRSLCRALGVEWPEGLYLADLVEKYVARAIVERSHVLEAALREALDGWAEWYAGDPSISASEAAVPHQRVEELRKLLDGK